MPRTPQDPNDFGAALAEIRDRLRALESGSGLRNASMSDPDGIVRVLIGRLGDGDYGLEVHNAAGLTVFKTESAGIVYPRQPLMITKGNDYVPITSATFVATWSMVTPYATADAVQVQTLISADASTTGEVRLSINVGGTTYSAVQSIAASSAAYFEWKWAPAGLMVGTGPIRVILEARRVSGAGNINVYPPVQAHNTTAASIAATPTGV